jgi:hypothetical protein
MVTKKLKLISVTDPPSKTRTELKQRIRSQSFSDASVAVAWLNAAQGTVAYRRVLEVRQELEELRAELDRLKQKTGSVVRVRDIADLQTRHERLDLKMARYSFKPELNYSFASGFWGLDMVPKHPRGPQVEMHGQGFAYRPRRILVSEPVVVTALARLAVSQELYKVRLCATCLERWRVSERKIDRFCSDKCRDAFHVSSPDYHERKAANQRKYRDNLKNGIALGASFK